MIGSSPTSDVIAAGAPSARPAVPLGVRYARFRAVLHFEVSAQLREPLTTLYVLVFGLLSFGYAASDAVELVSDRGAVPRTAPWALTLAFGGLTAFGQVITTMIATTAMLRDDAQRTRALVATSGLDARTWFVARLCAALVVMLVVYAAMPVGIALGTLVSGGEVAAAVGDGLRAYAVITVPTVFVVTVLLSCAALYSQRVLGVLAMALVLVGLWQLALAFAAHAHLATVGALLDPFGNAPVLVVTRTWPIGQRTHEVVPVWGLLLANRVLWALMAGTALMVTVRGGARRAFIVRGAPPAPVRDAHVGASVARAGSAFASVRRFTAQWMQHDGGWRAVSALAVLNALANGVSRAVSSTAAPIGSHEAIGATLLLISGHARLFLILLATVYAGELVWRERDVRVQQLVDTLPVPRTTLVLGRTIGLLAAQRAVVLPLAIAALVVAVVRNGMAPFAHTAPWLMWLAWSAFVLWLPFAQLTVLSLTVHVLVDHKVLAHLLLITGWVLAVVLNGYGITAWWLRFAEAPPLLSHGAVDWSTMTQRGAYWTAVSTALLMICWWRWPRGARARSA